MDRKPSYQELLNKIKALKNTEARYQALFEFAPGPICIEQINGGTIQPNRAMCDLFGYSKKELTEKSFDQLVHPEDIDIWRQKHALLLGGDVSVCQGEKRYVNKNGDIIWGITALSLLRDETGAPEIFTVQIQDITHIKQLEGQLLQAQKMKAIGTLAGGIAHDFNNLLMGIQGRVSLMLLDIHRPPTDHEHLKKIESHIRRAAGLTTQLLGFAKGGNYQLQKTNLANLINKEAGMFGRTHKQIRIEQQLINNLWPVKIDPAQIRQALLNIFINSAQSMPDGGTLLIKAENIKLTQMDNKPADVLPGVFVRTSITDTGVGMDQGTQQRIFEPFFTTKDMGKGTGLGLASAYGVIKHHGGFINVYSEKGQGATLSVYLPAITQEINMSIKETSKITTGHGMVLLVDDEEMIIEIGRQMIQRLGYSVLTADSGQKALRVYSENKNKIDMVILDMIMPDMGGEETFDQLMGTNPNIKIIISSGYSVNEKASELLKRGGAGFIQKPFNMNQLSETLNSIITKKP